MAEGGGRCRGGEEVTDGRGVVMSLRGEGGRDRMKKTWFLYRI